ncbi:hypothetical protein L3X38_017590 [Prunus dulcis]|uniref:DUF4218 domain-containing protein n=1 Tax=Prunus dulcis TaxID=3755 RepID=A0AAD4ZAA5_PRUDU|nr:hypothetical protein L3X38_017590 [Prunus dulcis]
MRHPVDALASNGIDNKWPSFASDPRNLRLGLSSDGFNPFDDLSSKYSCWPVILVAYNLLPSLCMSKENLMLTLLIPGPRQPRNDIDIYLEPLVEDLKELWINGVSVYDAFNKSTFNLKAILMWTINDFPAYGNLSGYSTKEVLQVVKNFNNDWGKAKKKINTKRKRETDKYSIWPWKKKSVFFELPYWEKLLIRHNLDVMHIEKNVCESIVDTLLNMMGKTKDNLKSRKDLKDMGIRKNLHPDDDGDCKILCLKSHNYHVLVQQVLLVALRGLLPKGPRVAIFRLCAFFNEVCQRVIDKNKLEVLEDDVAETLCMLERFFPPSFFDVMIHLPIHLAQEARIGGLVQFRWMYPFERYTKELKGYVKNHSCNEDLEDENIVEGRLIGQGKLKILSSNLLEIAHGYVLTNISEVEPYIEMHLEELKCSDKRLLKSESLLQKRHKATFSAWLGNKVRKGDSSNMSNLMKWLACGPREEVTSYSGYVINGNRFHTKYAEKSTQNRVFMLKQKPYVDQVQETAHMLLENYVTIVL